MKKYLIPNLKENTKIQISYTSKKLQSFFNIKDKTPFKHKHNVVYLGTCPDCSKTYVGQTKCRCEKRIIEHNKRDRNSHILKHSNEAKHSRLWLKDYQILGQGYNSDFKRKISEALFIQQHTPELNIQKSSYELKLFN